MNTIFIISQNTETLKIDTTRLNVLTCILHNRMDLGISYQMYHVEQLRRVAPSISYRKYNLRSM